MGRPSAGLYMIFLVIILVIQSSLLVGKGILLIDQHEGDALHLLQIVLRMGAGEWPHIDFTTPIGILAFAPVSWLISLGLGAGHAIMGGMILVALLMLPAIWWVGFSRLAPVPGYLFGAFLIILCTALVYGGPDQVSSISMYYNRWAWAAAFLLVLLAMVPTDLEVQVPDGVIYGLGLSFLLLSKITFFVALLPGIVLALVLRQHWSALIAALVSGLIALSVMTLFGGFEFWGAYLGDLRQVSGSGIRPQPSDSLIATLVGPTFIAANLCLLAGVVLLRQAGHGVEGVVLLVFAPAFVYVTYQNLGNDPKWLILLVLILTSLRPDRHLNNAFGWDVSRAMGVVSLIAGVLILPTVINLTTANLRHAGSERSSFSQVLPGLRNSDIGMQTKRMYAPASRIAFSLSDPKIKTLVERSTERVKDMLFGQPMLPCMLKMGLVGVLHQMARDLDAVDGTAGKTVFTADTFSNLWLFGETRPLPGGAPWYYGGDAGLGNADFILVPLCPITPRARTMVLNEIASQPDLILTEVMRNDLFVLLQKSD